MALNDSETLPIYDDESGKNPSSGQGMPRHNSVIDLGYGNIIAPSARMVFILGNNNTIGENAYGVSLINSSGVTVAGNLKNVSVFNSSGITVVDPNTATTQNVSIKPTQTIGYKKYVALISQVGTNAPTQIILENGLGDVPVWTRISTGRYELTLSGIFTANKTFILFGEREDTHLSNISVQANNQALSSINNITVFTRPLSGIGLIDDGLDKTPMEIRIYS